MSHLSLDQRVDRIQDHVYFLQDAIQPGCPVTHGVELVTTKGSSLLFFDDVHAAQEWIDLCFERGNLLGVRLWDLDHPDVNLVHTLTCERCGVLLTEDTKVTKRFDDESSDYCEICSDDLS